MLYKKFAKLLDYDFDDIKREFKINEGIIETISNSLSEIRSSSLSFVIFLGIIIPNLRAFCNCFFVRIKLLDSFEFLSLTVEPSIIGFF